MELRLNTPTENHKAGLLAEFKAVAKRKFFNFPWQSGHVSGQDMAGFEVEPRLQIFFSLEMHTHSASDRFIRYVHVQP